MPEEDIDLYGEYEDDHYEEPVRTAHLCIFRKAAVSIFTLARSPPQRFL